MIGLVQQTNDGLTDTTPDKIPIESLSGTSKEIINNLQTINLSFKETNLEYIDIVNWLKENITSPNVSPLISNFVDVSSIESSISRVSNILNGRGFNGTINIEKSEILNDAPAKTKVEVNLL